MARKRIYMNFSVELESIQHMNPRQDMIDFVQKCIEDEIRRRVADFVDGVYLSTVTLDAANVEDI